MLRHSGASEVGGEIWQTALLGFTGGASWIYGVHMYSGRSVHCGINFILILMSKHFTFL